MINKGDYTFGDYIRLSVYENQSEYERFHETTHLMLTKATLWGFTFYYISRIAGSDNRPLLDIVKVLTDACEVVYESYATVSTYFYAMVNKDYVEMAKIKSSLYHQVYNAEYFNLMEILTLEEIKKTSIHSRLPILALGTSISEYSSSDDIKTLLLKEKHKCPDSRFKLLVSSLKGLMKEKCIESISNDDLLERSGLSAMPQNNDDLLEYADTLRECMLNKYKCDEFMYRRILSMQFAVGDDDLRKRILDDYDQLALPLSEVNEYTSEYPPQLLDWYLDLNVMLVVLDGARQGANMVFIYMTEFKKRFGFELDSAQTELLLSRFKNEIIFFKEDYEKAQLFKCLDNRRVFYCFSDKYSDFKINLDRVALSTREVYLHQINIANYALFVKGPGNSIFFTPQLYTVIPRIHNDIMNRYYTYIDCKSGDTDGVFYLIDTDWVKYADVLKAISKTNDNGGRIQLDGFLMDDE